MTSGDRKNIVSPREHLGFEVGEDRKLADWSQMVSYFCGLGDASDRVATEEIGKTTEGNPFLVVTISSPDNIRRLDDYRTIQDRLADPRTIGDETEVDGLVAQGRTVVAVTCSIHATEVGAAQMSLRLGHHLATAEDEKTRRILENVILLLVPSMNPDGLTAVKEWYDGTVGTPYEGVNPPFLYHKYTGHDNNRDWFMFTQAETRLLVESCLNRWHPQVLFDLHQTRSSGMRMILPPFVDPVGPNVDPVQQSQLALLGSAMAAELTAQGKAGVAVNVVYDAYSPNRSYLNYHGGVRVLSEAASVRLATPMEVPQAQLRAARGEEPSKRSWNHPMPWQGGTWSLSDIVDYDFAAVMACLEHTARNRDTWLRNFYEVGKRAVTYAGNPSAFLIPRHQRDPVAATELLQTMHTAQVEVHEATESFVADGETHPAGTRVILTGQPYGAFAKTMLEVRSYPDVRAHPDGPPKSPYDVTAHNLPIQMDVDAIEVKASFTAQLERLEEVLPPEGKVDGCDPEEAAAYLLKPDANAGYRAINRLLSAGVEVRWAQAPVRTRAGDFAQGTFIVEAGPGVAELVSDLAREEHVGFRALDHNPKTKASDLRMPTIGIYKSFVPSVEEGWTRYVLDGHEVPYTSLVDGDVREGGLAERFDAILLPHQSVRHIDHGHNASQYHPAYSGGLGDAGAASLREFVEKGGTLIAWDGAAQYAIQHLALPVHNVLSGLSRADFFAPGSLLRVQLDVRHPIAYGMPANAAAMFVSGPAFDVREGTVVGKYPTGNPLLSGLLIGPEKLHGAACVATVPIGKGEVVLFGVRVHFRAQARGTYKLLFNSLLYSTMKG